MVADGEQQGMERQRRVQKSVTHYNGKAASAPASSDALLSKDAQVALTTYLQGIGFCKNIWASILRKSFV